MTDKEGTVSDPVVHIRGPMSCSGAHSPRYVIAEIIEAPHLHGLTTPDFVEFRNKREIYERRLASIDPGAEAYLYRQSYRDTIPRHLLNVLVQSGMVQATKVEEITEKDLKKCIEKNAIVDVKKHGFATIEQKLAGLSMEKPITRGGLTAGVMDLCVQYFSTLEKWGCDNLIEIAPDTAIDHILNHITSHHPLGTRISRIIKIREVDGMKKSFRQFFKQLLEEAHRIDNSFS